MGLFLVTLLNLLALRGVKQSLTNRIQSQNDVNFNIYHLWVLFTLFHVFYSFFSVEIQQNYCWLKITTFLSWMQPILHQ